ncbi:transcription elongation factor SPT4 [Brachionus plicatilis]|uniref:Transcription elongation factor SPT4 n=1 Tax=Brachionus plicatilis TaxID=10195 RepID=A0A3M7RG44_BRAPC|nr:transcription elongation factor SPT4 [Brachionus plicatilis]
MSASIPSTLRDLRACKICSLIKTLDQFDNEGCDNCDEFLHLKGNRDRVFDCTSSNFDGMIAMMDPSDSWVAKWQRVDHFVRGMYAISVSGELPDAIKRMLREKDMPYRTRDMSQRT